QAARHSLEAGRRPAQSGQGDHPGPSLRRRRFLLRRATRRRDHTVLELRRRLCFRRSGVADHSPVSERRQSPALFDAELARSHADRSLSHRQPPGIRHKWDTAAPPGKLAAGAARRFDRSTRGANTLVAQLSHGRRCLGETRHQARTGHRAQCPHLRRRTGAVGLRAAADRRRTDGGEAGGL
ncbi:uncharacterized protein METZ01_LOCUS186520, partial [marine metagenome]